MENAGEVICSISHGYCLLKIVYQNGKGELPDLDLIVMSFLRRLLGLARLRFSDGVVIICYAGYREVKL